MYPRMPLKITKEPINFYDFPDSLIRRRETIWECAEHFSTGELYVHLRDDFKVLLRALLKKLNDALKNGYYYPGDFLQNFLIYDSDKVKWSGKTPVNACGREKFMVGNGHQYVVLVRHLLASFPMPHNLPEPPSVTLFFKLAETLDNKQSHGRDTVYLLYNNPLTWGVRSRAFLIQKLDEIRRSKKEKFYHHLIHCYDTVLDPLRDWGDKLRKTVYYNTFTYKGRDEKGYKEPATIMEYFRHTWYHIQEQKYYHAHRSKITLDDFAEIFPDAEAIMFYALVREKNGNIRDRFKKEYLEMDLIDYLKEEPFAIGPE